MPFASYVLLHSWTEARRVEKIKNIHLPDALIFARKMCRDIGEYVTVDGACVLPRGKNVGGSAITSG
jgi:hypothetical protein